MGKVLCGIYCIENMINHKKYIGLSRDIHRRWCEHKSELKTKTHDNQYLQSSWDKYGEENFDFYIVELCNEGVLSERERYYIKYYKTYAHEQGYNLTSGGENNSYCKPVINLRNKTIYYSVKDAAKSANVVSLTMISWCQQNHNYMYLDDFNNLTIEEKLHISDFNWEEYEHNKLSKSHSRENLSMETLQKLSDATSGKNNPRAFAVYCPQLDEKFDCAKDATIKYGVNRGSISQCIKGKLKSAGTHPVTGEKLTWEKL